MSLHLTPDSVLRKRSADDMAADLVSAMTSDSPIPASAPASANHAGTVGKNPLHWKDDGKDSNCVQLAEATLRLNPFQSKWGDIAANWNRVLKDLQEKGVVGPDKDYRCLQHKMKSMLDQLRTHNEALKMLPPSAHNTRRPFSDKLYGLLCEILVAADNADRERGTEKKSKKRTSLNSSDLSSPLRTPPGDMESITLAANDQAVDGSSLLLSGTLIHKENGAKSLEQQRRYELEERDQRIDQALAEARQALEREKLAYEKKRQELDDARLLRDAQIAEVMKQTLTTVTQVVDVLRNV